MKAGHRSHSSYYIDLPNGTSISLYSFYTIDSRGRLGARNQRFKNLSPDFVRSILKTRKL